MQLAIITTHPIQYNAPLFALLAKRGNIDLKVFYTWGEKVLNNKFDPGFGKAVEWDIPLLEGYDYSFVENTASDPGSHHFKGIDNPTLIKEIENWKADAVLVYGWSFKSHLKALRHFSGRIPVYFRGDSTILHLPGMLTKLWRKMLLSWVYQYVDTAFYVGSHNKAYYRSFGLKEKQLVFAPHAIDNDRFEKNSQDQEYRKSQREALGISGTDTVFLYAGKLDENKNVGRLAGVFTRLNHPDIHLIIAGSGPEEARLKDHFGANPKIHFLPFQNQEEMPALYGLADVFVLPSKAETWGLAINEAMACGKAIIASNGCAAAIDLVKEGINGYRFNNNDQEDLAGKMNVVLQHKEKIGAMGNASREIIASWNFEHICEAIEKKLWQNRES